MIPTRIGAIVVAGLVLGSGPALAGPSSVAGQQLIEPASQIQQVRVRHVRRARGTPFPAAVIGGLLSGVVGGVLGGAVGGNCYYNDCGYYDGGGYYGGVPVYGGGYYGGGVGRGGGARIGGGVGRGGGGARVGGAGGHAGGHH